MEKRFLSVKQLAEFLGISVFFVYKLKSEKKIPFCKFGRRVMFDKEQIEKWIKEHSIEPIENWSEKLGLR